MTMRLLNIGVICLDAGQAATVTDHIRAITDGSRHHSLVLPVWPHNTLQHIELGLFDVLVIHYTIVAKEHTFLLPAVREQIAKFPGLKVAFIQDEYRFVNATIDALRELGIRLLFTCVPEGEIEKVYSPERLPGVTVVPVLTGYVPNDLAELEVPPYGHRAIDVGYRSRKVPTWLGDLGWEKYIISVKFPEAAARYRLRLDISCREVDRIYGEDWIRFIYNCKAFLGVESGASVFDFTGDIQRQVEAHEDREPNVGFEELQRLYFAEQEGKIRLNQISPRCFEATSLRTLLVLYEGDYSGILVPWRHYIPLKKDHSNVDEVVKILLDRRRAETVIEAAYSEVACNPEYSFANFSGRFDHEIETMISPEGLRRTNPDHVRKAIAAASGRAALEKNAISASGGGSTGSARLFQVHRDLKRLLLYCISRYRLLSLARSRLFTVALAAIFLPVRRRSKKGAGWSWLYQKLLGVLGRVHPMLPTRGRRRRVPTVVFLHSSYYHFFLLARELRQRGWNAWAVTLDDPEDIDAAYSHGVDISLHRSNSEFREFTIDRFLGEVKRKCDILYFSGVGMMRCSEEQGDLSLLQPRFPREFTDLKNSGVRIGYSCVGCNDGISQSEWYEWTGGMCDKCRFQAEPDICSDTRNLGWGHKLAMVCDLVATEQNPRLGYLAGETIVSTPFAFCVDEEEWRPGLEIPDEFQITSDPADVIVLHAVGNFAKRASGTADPKGTRHVIKTVESLRAEGVPIRLHFVDNVASGDMKYVQTQADIVVDQLYFGRYGAMARECLMLGKPVVGFLKVNREEECDEALACLDECPIVNASPETLKEVLRDLVTSKDKRIDIGRRSREFAVKWHSVAAAADRFEGAWRERFGIGG